MKALIARAKLRLSRPVIASRRSTGSPAARLAARRRILRSPPEQGSIPASRAAVAAVQSIAACVTRLLRWACSPVVMCRVKSSRCRKVSWPMSRLDGGLVVVDAAGAGAQGLREVMLICQATGHGVWSLPGGWVAGRRHPAMRVKDGMPRSVAAGWRAVRASSACSFPLTVARET